MENIVVPRALLTSRTPEEAGLDDGSAVDEIYNLYSGHERGVSIYNERSERRNTYQRFSRQSRMPIISALNPEDTSPDLGWRHSAGPFSPYSDPETPGPQGEYIPRRQEESGEERQETLSISSFETSSSEDLSASSEPEVTEERHSHTASRDLLSNTPFKLQPAPDRKNLRPAPIQILNVPVAPRIIDLAAEEQRDITITEEPSLNRGPSKKNKRKSVLHRASVFIKGHGRKTSLAELYTTAKTRQKVMNRSKLVQRCFELAVYGLIIAVIYFIFVGMPLWKGCVFWLYWITAHKFVVPGGFTIVLGIAFLYAFLPLVILFEPDPPAQTVVSEKEPPVTSVALLIPCYKSAKILPATLKAALLVFPAESIFVLSNGNSATPLDNTAEVCAEYGVNHTWTPIGSKIIAQFIGCYVSKSYPHVLLIDDDCLLPPNFPLSPVEKLKDKVKVIGYTIKSVGANGSRGTLAQRAQDLEYKLSGLQRTFAGKVGSATFPHGAISLWDREFLLETFKSHPGFSVSEDWFFGHVSRTLGSRIVMSTSVFVETETPASIFWNSGGGDRGGFGEMTIYQQRFKRWNFFFVNGMYWNMRYILCSWKLGWWEIGSKIFVFQEVYETLLYLATPFVLPISFIVRPLFCTYLLIATFGIYLLTVIFNEVHLRRKNQRVDTLAIIYYMPYKMILTFINVASCYWSILKYASYFARRHPKVVEDEKVIEVALRIEEEALYDWDEFRETLHTPAPSLRSPSIRGTPAQSLRSFI